jgi:GTPase SAR1 family protein
MLDSSSGERGAAPDDMAAPIRERRIDDSFLKSSQASDSATKRKKKKKKHRHHHRRGNEPVSAKQEELRTAKESAAEKVREQRRASLGRTLAEKKQSRERLKQKRDKERRQREDALAARAGARKVEVEKIQRERDERIARDRAALLQRQKERRKKEAAAREAARAQREAEAARARQAMEAAKDLAAKRVVEDSSETDEEARQYIDESDLEEERYLEFKERNRAYMATKAKIVQDIYVQDPDRQKVTADWMDFHFFVIGDGAVGKSCLCQALDSRSYDDDYMPTTYEEFTGFIKVKSKSGGESVVQWTLHDTAGQEDVFAITQTMLGGGLGLDATKCVIFCANVMDKNSLHNLQGWVENVKTKCNLGFRDDEVADEDGKMRPWFIVVGTQEDRRSDVDELDDNRQKGYEHFDEEYGREYARKLGAYGYVECSALMYSGIREVFSMASQCAAKFKGRSFD